MPKESKVEEFENFLLKTLKRENTLEPIIDPYDDINFFDSKVSFEEKPSENNIFEEDPLLSGINILPA